METQVKVQLSQLFSSVALQEPRLVPMFPVSGNVSKIQNIIQGEAMIKHMLNIREAEVTALW